MKIDELRTPALILDRARLRRNLQRMAERAANLGVALRPHLKTAKSAEVARLATEGQAGGITVSTLAEAELFAEHGFADITYGVGITPDKLADVARLQQSTGGRRLNLVTDDADGVVALAQRAGALNVDIDLLIEVDCGQHRAGVPADGPAFGAIAETISASPRLNLKGVLTHAGHSYSCSSPDEIRAIAEDERGAAVAAAARLRDSGYRCDIVSVGSSPTALFADSLDGVTEMRPGVYMFQDLFQTSLGCCGPEDIAVSLLATVVGGRRAERVLIDAGALALSQDTCVAGPDGKPAYGQVWDRDCQAPLAGACVAAVNQEHGFVATANGDAGALLHVGQKVRVLPNHACMMAAMHDRYHVVDGGDEIVDIWSRGHGW